jgi:hypothetical protein
MRTVAAGQASTLLPELLGLSELSKRAAPFAAASPRSFGRHQVVRVSVVEMELEEEIWGAIEMGAY